MYQIYNTKPTSSVFNMMIDLMSLIGDTIET